MDDSKPGKGSIDEAAQYRLRLTGKLLVGRTWLSSRTDNVVRGDVLLAIYDSEQIAGFEPVQPIAAPAG